jgi:hypothetical protein
MARKQTSFERVMAAVAAKYRAERGTDLGVSTWLAKGIGAQRQAMTNFKNRGRFPDGYLAKISKFTGIPVPTLQGDPTDEVVELSRKWRISVRDTEIALIRIGLDHANRK